MGGALTNGTDTTEAYPVAQDVFGFSLHYYKGDYKAIGYTLQATSVLGGLGTNAAPLYNGNIAAMAVNIPKLGSSKVYNYHYDQLNRIVAMDLFNGLNVNAGTFNAAISTDYQERTSYDPNGNILTYLRNGDGNRLSMDNLSYFYKSGTNQLHKVTDGAADASANDYSKYNDLRQGQLDSNYRYDAIGNLTSDAKDTITSITWNVYGKIQSITKNGQVIRYIYDAAGNRIFKYTPTDTTAYVRDASGNVLSVYSRPAGQSPIVQSETHLYGSSRLGIATRHLAADTTIVLSGGFGLGQNSIFTRGEKLFELSNHLGNVLASIADRRIPVDANSDGIIESYKADLVSAQDYYPFGMQMPGRKYSSSAWYRYGFNGKEKADEVYGEGNVSDYGFRIYNPRLARFLSVDPLQKKYPELTPFQFSHNAPIDGVDLDGRERYDMRLITNDDGSTKLQTISTGPESERRASSFWKITKVTPHIRLEYNGQHYIFADGRNRGELFDEVFNVQVNYMKDFNEFVANPNPDAHQSQEEAHDVFLSELAGRTAIGLVGEVSNRSMYGVANRIQWRGRYTNRSATQQQATSNGGITLKNSTPQQGSGFRTYNTRIQDGGISAVTGKGAINTTGRYDFVITKEGKLVIGTGHYNLSGGASSVQAAGQMKIINGRVREITNSSGHYKPTVQEGKQSVNLLQDMGINTSGSRVSLYNGDGSLNKTYIKQ